MKNSRLKSMEKALKEDAISADGTANVPKLIIVDNINQLPPANTAKGASIMVGGVPYSCDGVGFKPILTLRDSIKQAIKFNAPQYTKKVMSSPPTVTSSGTQTLTGLDYNITEPATAYTAPGRHTGVITYCNLSVDLQDVSSGTSVSGAKTNSYCKYAFNFDGTNFEFCVRGTANTFLVKFNGEYVSATPTSTGASGYTYFKYAFGSRVAGVVEIIGKYIYLTDIIVDQSANISPAPLIGPKIAIVGDSFGAFADGYVNAISDITGWNQLWSFSIGGTGWTANNANNSLNWVDRIADVTAIGGFDLVWFVGSINDNGATQALLDTQIRAGVSAIRSAMPNAVIALSPTSSRGVGNWPSNQIANMKQMQATAQSVGAVFANPLEDRITYKGTWVANVYQAASAGATTIRLVGFGNDATPSSSFPLGHVEIIDGVKTERVHITGIALTGWTGTPSASDPYYTCTLASALQYAHDTTATAQLVGSSYITGIGYVGATTGVGNSDIYCNSDGIHPTTAGGVALALNLMNALYASL